MALIKQWFERRSAGSSPPLGEFERMLLRSLVHTRWTEPDVRQTLPELSFTFRPPDEPDTGLCKRLIEAHARSASADPGTSGVWKGLLAMPHFQALGEALQAGDTGALAGLLSRMFQESCVYGVAMGNLHRGATTPDALRVWHVKNVDFLVSLGEALGVVRTECPEQGQPGYGVVDGLDVLVERIEGTLGVSIDFPRVGAAYGLESRGHLVTMESPEHIYAAWRLKGAIATWLKDDGKPLEVVEIGGGFGGLAWWARTVLGLQRYTIIDLPVINVLQGYFLGRAVGVDKVQLYGEDGEDRPVAVMPTTALPNRHVRVMINENSMPEMPEAAVNGYVSWAREHVTGLFFSYNHEAYAPIDGLPQVRVGDVVDRVGGLRRVSRSASWLRRGYVEEVYVPAVS